MYNSMKYEYIMQLFGMIDKFKKFVKLQLSVFKNK